MKSKPRWIWTGYGGTDIVNTYMQARRTFTLQRVPRKALLNITADYRYQLWVNGTWICKGPARGFQESWPYDSVDISHALKKGKNAIAVLVHSLGIGTHSYIHQGYSGLLVWGTIGTENVASGDTWRVRKAPGMLAVLSRVSMMMGFQEHYDARQDSDGTAWRNPSFDDTRWESPNPWFSRPIGGQPWPGLEPRGLPMFRSEAISPRRITLQAQGKSIAGWREATNPVQLFHSETRQWQSHPIELSGKSNWTTLGIPSGTKDSYTTYCLDFGEEVLGSFAFQIEGATGGEMVEYLVHEHISDDGSNMNYQESSKWRTDGYGNRIMCRNGTTKHEQFDHWGFRFLVINVRGATRPMKVKLQFTLFEYPYDITSSFTSSDPILNAVYDISVRTQKRCTLDSYMDCPWREQAHYWGDARVQAANSFYMSADPRVLTRGLRLIGTQQIANGLTYGCGPTKAHESVIPDFTLIWILTFRDLWWQTGETEVFAGMKNRVHKALEYFHGQAAPTGLLPFDDRYWLFLDWTAVFKDGYATLYNLLYLAALRAAKDLFSLVDDKASAEKYRKQASALEKNITGKLLDKKTGSVYGGLNWKQKPVKQDSPHVYALTILLDLFPQHKEMHLKKYLIPYVTKPVPLGSQAYRRLGQKPTLEASPFFMYYILEALKKEGATGQVVSCIQRWWGDMVKRGLTTTEENWSAPPGGESLCHAWSAHPIVHLSNCVLGVWQTKPGWKQIRFSPDFSTVDAAEGAVATPHGPIQVAWKKNGKVDVSLELPDGLEGLIDIPGLRKKKVRGSFQGQF